MFWLWGLLSHFTPFNTYFRRKKFKCWDVVRPEAGCIKNYGSGLKLREKYKVLWIWNNGGIEAAVGQCQLCHFPFRLSILLIFLTDNVMLEPQVLGLPFCTSTSKLKIKKKTTTAALVVNNHKIWLWHLNCIYFFTLFPWEECLKNYWSKQTKKSHKFFVTCVG